MGLLREILLLPAAPLRTTLWALEQALDEAKRQQRDGIRRELVDLERQLQDGIISAERFDGREDELLDDLAELDQG